MTLQEIKDAVESGKNVCWKSTAYDVINPIPDQWLIMCNNNQNCVGLTHTDNVTMSEDEGDFFIKN